MKSHSLEIDNITVSYGRVPVLHHLQLSLSCGQCVGLIGPNGAGKTTFLKAIAGLVPLETGSISLHGERLKKSFRKVSYLPQRESIDWDFPITVRGLVEMGRFPEMGLWKSFSAEDAKIVEEALRALNLIDLADRQIKALSGGQQQKVFLARCWAQRAHVYLLDEPFNGLDKNAQEDLSAALRLLAREGKLIIASHHNLKTVPELFDQVVLLNGELIAAGAVSDVFRPDLIERTFVTQIFTGTT